MTNTDVVKKIIGNVQPYGSAKIDCDRMGNLKDLCELVSDLIDELKEVSFHRDRQEHSMKEMGEYAHKFLSNLLT